MKDLLDRAAHVLQSTGCAVEVKPGFDANQARFDVYARINAMRAWVCLPYTFEMLSYGNHEELDAYILRDLHQLLAGLARQRLGPGVLEPDGPGRFRYTPTFIPA